MNPSFLMWEGGVQGHPPYNNMALSYNGVSPKSSICKWVFHEINHPSIGYLHFRNHVLILAGYFHGIIHSANGVISVLILVFRTITVQQYHQVLSGKLAMLWKITSYSIGRSSIQFYTVYTWFGCHIENHVNRLFHLWWPSGKHTN